MKKTEPRPVRMMHKKGVFIISSLIIGILAGLFFRLAKLMIFDSEHYQELARQLHTRERSIKAKRGEITDRNGIVLASNRTVCTVSVIHSQVKDKQEAIKVLSSELGIAEEEIIKKIEKVTAREIIKTNVEKEIADRIREKDIAGIKVDEDYKRFYPYGELASKVLGFTGSDNQGIIGLEVQYDNVLQGKSGKILTFTDAAGIELDNAAEYRQEPVAGNTLALTIDWNIQSFVHQVCMETLERKQAKQVSAIVLDPENGEIYAMVNVPEFDLNDPFSLQGGENITDEKQRMELLNEKWRNWNISDTYEPGSAFKTVTAAAALDAGVVSLDDRFSCPGYYVVGKRRIRCARVSGHGAETFVDGIKNSCNPVFIQVGLRLGAEKFYSYFKQFKLLEKTGVDLPGEAVTIMHKLSDMKELEVATVSFGQSFQLTSLRLASVISSIINGGQSITPHLGRYIYSSDESEARKIEYKKSEQILDKDISAVMRQCLEKVVSEGGGKKAYIEGYRIGGKTATSEKLPRGNGKYLSSFVGFVPADDPKVLAIMIVDEPQGVYYGGSVAAPQIKKIFENILPYLDIEQSKTLIDDKQS